MKTSFEVCLRRAPQSRGPLRRGCYGVAYNSLNRIQIRIPTHYISLISSKLGDMKAVDKVWEIIDKRLTFLERLYCDPFI